MAELHTLACVPVAPAARSGRGSSLACAPSPDMLPLVSGPFGRHQVGLSGAFSAVAGLAPPASLLLLGELLASLKEGLVL